MVPGVGGFVRIFKISRTSRKFGSHTQPKCHGWDSTVKLDKSLYKISLLKDKTIGDKLMYTPNYDN